VAAVRQELSRTTRRVAREHDNHNGRDGTGGSARAVLPELRIVLGGFSLVYRDAPALLSATIPVSNWHYGQLGIDQLAQASEVTIDFRELKIQLR